jgi:methylglutaconyl-CoA hydratase
MGENELKEIQIFVTKHVGTITLFRPQRGNSITPSMGLEIIAILDRWRQDPEIRVVILTGSGKFFCTGMDLGNSNQDQMGQLVKDGKTGDTGQIFEVLRNFPKPIICQVNGPVLGGGVGVVFTTDIRIVNRKAYFCFPEVKRGIAPALISAHITPELGPYLTRQYMLTGEKVGAEDLYRRGVVTALVDSEQDMHRVTQTYVEQLLTSAPNAMSSVKNLINFVSSHGHDQNMSFTRKVFAEMVRSEEAMYGISCFLQKQQPDWSEFLKRSKL